MFIEKVVLYERTKVDGHYRQTVEIFYNFIRAIDRSIWAASSPVKMIETDKQQGKRRGITPRLTLNTPYLLKNSYGKTNYGGVFCMFLITIKHFVFCGLL